MTDQNQRIRIESEAEVKAYLQKLRYALDHGAQVEVLIQRRVDKNRNPKYTNGYTLNKLFPGEDPKDVLRIELKKLTVENYMQTVKDIRYPDRSEMREFGTTYNGCLMYI